MLVARDRMPGAGRRGPAPLTAVEISTQGTSLLGVATYEDDDHQIGYQALPRGVPVHASDGVRLGTVHRVLDNAREHIFDGIVLDTEHGRRFVDAPEVARITLRRVTLTIDAAEAARLTPYHGRLGSLQTRAERARRRWRRRLPGR
jgi:hypothetical protein